MVDALFASSEALLVMRNTIAGSPREAAPVSSVDDARASYVFARFRRQWAALTGADIGADKRRVVERRLGPVMRAHDVSDLFELTLLIERNGNEALIEEAIDAMTASETSFFRDRAPFEAFRARILPELMAARGRERRLRIWCAAVSTGREAYSLAMMLDEAARELRGWSLEILGTDISGAAIETARKGIYTHFEVQQGLSTTHLLRYFHREEENWRVNEHLRARRLRSVQSSVQPRRTRRVRRDPLSQRGDEFRAGSQARRFGAPRRSARRRRLSVSWRRRDRRRGRPVLHPDRAPKRMAPPRAPASATVAGLI
jgi:hypothetical protein